MQDDASSSDISDLMSRTSLEDQESSRQEQSQQQPQQQHQRQLHRRQQQQSQRFRAQGPRNQRKKYPHNPADPARLALDDLRTLDYRMVPDEHYFIDERGNRRLVPKFPSSTLDSDPVARTRRELEMEWQRRVLEASVASE